MRIIRWTVMVVALAALALGAMPTAKMSSTTFAADIVPIKPKPNYCRIACLTGPSGDYCGIGAGVKGCVKVLNGNCVFTICPN